MSDTNDAEGAASAVRLSDAYRSTLSCGLALVEDMLSDMSSAVENTIGRVSGALQPAQEAHVQTMKREIAAMREAIEQMRSDMNLNRRSEDLGSTVLSRCAKTWEILCNMKTSRLRGYGDTPAGLPDYLDPRIDAMLANVDQILAAAKALVRDTPGSPHAGNVDETCV